MSMSLADLLRQQQQPKPETPEEQEHHRRLEHRRDRYTIHWVDGSEPLVAEGKAGEYDPVRMGAEGVAVLAEVAEGTSEHDWEERGSTVLYPWHKVAKIEHSWWVPDEVLEVDRDRPSPYL